MYGIIRQQANDARPHRIWNDQVESESQSESLQDTSSTSDDFGSSVTIVRHGNHYPTILYFAALSLRHAECSAIRIHKRSNKSFVLARPNCRLSNDPTSASNRSP